MGLRVNRETMERIRALLAEQGQAADLPPAPAKYRNEPVTIDGERFDSRREARRWLELRAWERAGRISGLRRQVKYPLVVNSTLIASYVADFVYERDGREVVEDAKGFRTPAYKLKRKLMRAVHGITVEEV